MAVHTESRKDSRPSQAVAGTERYEGRLAPGLVADVTVLGADPLAVAPDELPDVPVRATIVAGEVVYRGDGAA